MRGHFTGMEMVGTFSVQSHERDSRNFNKILAEGTLYDDGSVMVNKLKGWRKGVIRKYFDSMEDLLKTLENVKFVYHIEKDDYTHICPSVLDDEIESMLST